MKKKPQPPQRPKPGTLQPGGPVVFTGGTAPPTRKPPPRKPAPRPAPQPPALQPGGAVSLVPAPARKPAARKPPVKRKLALGEAVACCAADALAASLRLTGWPVSDADVLALYELTAAGPDEGATISATLEAAVSGFGLAGARLVSYEPLVMPCTTSVLSGPFAALGSAGEGHDEFAVPAFTANQQVERLGHALILGVDLPGPHTVYDDGEAWWSWGQPYDPAAFPGAVIEEAWQVTW